VHRQGIASETKAVDEAYYNLGLVLRGQERYAEARECFVAALAAAEDDDYEEASRALEDVEKAMKYLEHGASGVGDARREG
jgi:tetratricopeptide (TPR) repeat protein